MVPAAALALERLLARRRELGGILLNADMFDRWGPKEGPERDRVMAEEARAQREHAEVTARLAALARETWASDPGAVRAWAEAHVDLLERFVRETAGDADRDTARYVAGQEIAAWREVAAGARPYVDENVYYVRVDPAGYAEYFGPPG